jgi:hypothetical protein
MFAGYAGTTQPPGVWNWFAQLLSLQRGLNLNQDINMYYSVGAAMYDATIAAFTQKRLVSSYRPMSAIR